MGRDQHPPLSAVDNESGVAVENESGVRIAPVYRPDDVPSQDGIGAPGEFPFTRGNFPGGYRDRVWTFRQYSGFGTAEESNARYRYLLREGGTGLSVALDLPTQCGHDSDDPDVEGEVGRVGVAVDTLRDVEVLFEDIPLDRVSTSFTINGTAAILLAMYVATAERRGISPSDLRGTIQNDILKEYAARGTWIWPPTPSMRLIADTIEFCASEVPRFNAISVAGAHFRDAGSNAAQEMAFTLADGVAYCDEVIQRGRMTIDEFAPQISFFFYTHGAFFEEVAKYRAGRRRWATIVRERYGSREDRSCMFRFGCVCGGASLYAPQAENNIVRVAYEAMASAFGGVQSMFTAAWDEPFALPTEASTTLALRTQQVLAYETGTTDVVDPLGGSYYVEALTDAMEQRIVDIMSSVEEQGGMVRGVEEGYVQRLIADEAYAKQRAVETGERKIVGVNCFTTDEPMPEVQAYEMNASDLQRQLGRLADTRRTRDNAEVRHALDQLRAAARTDDVNLMPPLIACAHAYCTIGEMVNVLKDEWGEFRQPTVF